MLCQPISSFQKGIGQNRQKHLAPLPQTETCFLLPASCFLLPKRSSAFA